MAKLTLKEKKAQGIPKPYKGRRKKLLKERLRQKRASEVRVRLSNFPYSPRKMRPLAKLIKGRYVADALAILKWNPRKGAKALVKLILNGIDSWEQKFGAEAIDQGTLYIKEIRVDQGIMLKRIRPAPFGRAHRIRKRRCHVTLWLDDAAKIPEEETTNAANS